jgi:hypothetical protein
MIIAGNGEKGSKTRCFSLISRHKLKYGIIIAKKAYNIIAE